MSELRLIKLALKCSEATLLFVILNLIQSLNEIFVTVTSGGGEGQVCIYIELYSSVFTVE